MASAIAIDYGRLTRELGIDQDKIARTVALLDDGNTVPFITRYRRDQTGGLDEEQIGRIRDGITRLRLLDERKQTILRSIESQHALTDELRRQIDKPTASSGSKICISHSTQETNAGHEGSRAGSRTTRPGDPVARQGGGRSRRARRRLRQHGQRHARTPRPRCWAPVTSWPSNSARTPNYARESASSTARPASSPARRSKTIRRRTNSSTITSTSASRSAAFRRTACWRSTAASGPRYYA